MEGGGRGNPLGYTGENLLGEYNREGIISRVLKYKLRSLEKGIEFGKRRRVNFQRQNVSIFVKMWEFSSLEICEKKPFYKSDNSCDRSFYIEVGVPGYFS